MCPRSARETSLDRAMYHGGQCNPVRNVQLGEHVPEMGIHGVRRDIQPPGHGVVRQSLGHQPRHRLLRPGQTLPAVCWTVPRSARAGTYANGTQLHPDPACPRIGACLLIALQSFCQQRRCLALPPAAGQQPRGVLAGAGMLEQERRLTGECDRLDHRLDLAVDQSLAAQSQAAHRRHLGRQRDSCRDDGRHLCGHVTLAQRQGQPHEIRSKTAVVVATLACGVEPPAPQQQGVSALCIALGLLQPGDREREDPGVVAQLRALQ